MITNFQRVLNIVSLVCDFLTLRTALHPDTSLIPDELASLEKLKTPDSCVLSFPIDLYKPRYKPSLSFILPGTVERYSSTNLKPILPSVCRASPLPPSPTKHHHRLSSFSSSVFCGSLSSGSFLSTPQQAQISSKQKWKIAFLDVVPTDTSNYIQITLF